MLAQRSPCGQNDSFKQHTVLIDARKETLQATKYILNRLSKENLKKFGRQIGKLSHSNPGQCLRLDAVVAVTVVDVVIAVVAGCRVQGAGCLKY